MTLRVGCIGAGFFSQFHVAGWRAIDGAELVGVADRDLEKAQATGAPAYDDPERMIAEAGVELLDIIAPPVAHRELIELGLRAGVRAIICQKPFCTSLAEARAAAAAAEAAGVPLVVHENFRFQPWYRVMKREIESGRIGELLNLTFRLRPGDGQGPEAYLSRQPYFQKMPRFLVRETGVHWIDVFRFLLGEPEAVWADLRRLNPAIDGEDAGMLVFRYPSGARAVFDGNRLLDHPAVDLRRTMGEAWAEGTEGVLRLSGDGGVHLRRFGDAAWESLAPPPDDPSFGGGCVAALQRHVVEAIASGAAPENLAADYLRNLEWEEAAYTSAETGVWTSACKTA